MTTREALTTILRCHAAIARNTWRTANSSAHACPWAFILAVVVISTLVSLANIGQARLERDAAGAHVLKLQDSINYLNNTIEAKTYLQR